MSLLWEIRLIWINSETLTPYAAAKTRKNNYGKAEVNPFVVKSGSELSIVAIEVGIEVRERLSSQMSKFFLEVVTWIPVMIGS